MNKCKNGQNTFQRDYINKRAKLETKRLIIKMLVNGNRIRNISRALEIIKDMVIKVLKNGRKTYP